MQVEVWHAAKVKLTLTLKVLILSILPVCFVVYVYCLIFVLLTILCSCLFFLFLLFKGFIEFDNIIKYPNYSNITYHEQKGERVLAIFSYQPNSQMAVCTSLEKQLDPRCTIASRGALYQ